MPKSVQMVGTALIFITRGGGGGGGDRREWMVLEDGYSCTARGGRLMEAGKVWGGEWHGEIKGVQGGLI